MEDTILKLLNYRNYSKAKLALKLQITADELDIYLNNLLDSHLIYINENDEYSKISDDLVVGKLECNAKGYFYLRNKKDIIYINKYQLNTTRIGDIVVAMPITIHKGKIIGLIKRANRKYVCEVKKDKNGALYIEPFNDGSNIDVILDDNVLEQQVEGNRICITLDNKINDKNEIHPKDIKIIGHKDDPHSDEIAIAISKDFDVDFSEDVNLELKRIPNKVSNKDKEKRVDLTNEEIFTLDCSGCKDMDDAVSIKKLPNGNYLLGVHIMDVSYYVKPNDAIFREAQKRGLSLYFGNTVIPMLPHALSNGICSLNENKERLAKTCLMEINPNGNVLNYKFFNSVIKSCKKMNYDEVNNIYNFRPSDKSYNPYLKSLFMLKDLSQILSKKREKQGAIDFQTTEVKTTPNNEQFINKENGEAGMVIENSMILYNLMMANYMFNKNVPFLYRIDDIPDQDKLNETVDIIANLGFKLTQIEDEYGPKAIQEILNKFVGTPEYGIVANLLLRNMAKAKYSTYNIGHFPLAEDKYCHATSPIRRFNDLVIQTLFNDYENGFYSFGNINKLKAKLEAICSHINYKERQEKEAERDYVKLKMVRNMEKHIGESFVGEIIDIDRNQILIRLNNNIEGIVDISPFVNKCYNLNSRLKTLTNRISNHMLTLGAYIEVKVKDVSLSKKEVYFEIERIISIPKIENNLKRMKL
jgi:ribonuclease R